MDGSYVTEDLFWGVSRGGLLFHMLKGGVTIRAAGSLGICCGQGSRFVWVKAPGSWADGATVRSSYWNKSVETGEGSCFFSLPASVGALGVLSSPNDRFYCSMEWGHKQTLTQGCPTLVLGGCSPV